MKLVKVRRNHSISWRLSSLSAHKKTTMSNGGSCFRSYINHFLSADTIVPDPSDPQTLNRYAYALNNPLKYRDPSGHCVDYASVNDTELFNVCMEGWQLLYEYYRDEMGIIPNEWLSFVMTDYDIEEMDSLLSGYGVNWEYEWPGPDTVPVATPPIIGFGLSFNGDSGVSAGIVGIEVVFNGKTGEITPFVVTGNGPSSGYGGNAAAYLALYSNVEENSDIAGDGIAFDVTASVLGEGVVVGRSGSDRERDLLNPQEPYSWYLGWAPGVNASLSTLNTTYTPLTVALGELAR